MNIASVGMFAPIVLSALLTGCATVTSNMESVTSNMVSSASAVTGTMSTTASEVTSTVGTTMNESSVWVGENTGITTLVKAGTAMTPRQSYLLGRICAAKVLAEREVVTKHQISEYVNTLGNYLALHSQSPETYKGYQFVVTEGNAPEAVSTPGGFVFISKGMLSLVDSEDELAAVLAHEIAHVSLRHAEASIQTASRLDLMGGALLKTATYAANLATKTIGLDRVKVLNDLKVLKILKTFEVLTDIVLNQGFNQPQEYEADREAVGILKAAGYNPLALSGIIGKLSDDTNFISLHPGGEKRVGKIHDLLGAAGRNIASADDTRNRFRNFQLVLSPPDLVEDRY